MHFFTFSSKLSESIKTLKKKKVSLKLGTWPLPILIQIKSHPKTPQTKIFFG